MQNPIYLNTARGEFVLKEKRNEFSFDENVPNNASLHLNAKVFEHLRKNGFYGISNIKLASNGLPYFIHKGRYFVLHEFVKGRNNIVDDASWFKLIAEYHNAVEDFYFNNEAPGITRSEKRFQTMLAVASKRFEDILKLNEDKRSLFEMRFLEHYPFLMECAEMNDRVMSARLPKLITHGDAGPGNVIVNAQNRPVFIDERFCFDARIRELAKFRPSDEISEVLVIRRLRLYQEHLIKKLSPDELVSLEPVFVTYGVASYIWHSEKHDIGFGSKQTWLTPENLDRKILRLQKIVSLDWNIIRKSVGTNGY